MNLLLERYKWKSIEGDFYIDAFFRISNGFSWLKKYTTEGKTFTYLNGIIKETKHNMQLKIKLSTSVVTFDMFYMYTSSWTI